MPRVKRAYVPKIRGCYECSQRRIHCDRAEPDCKKCISKGLQCSGLGVRYRFDNDKHKLRTHRGNVSFKTNNEVAIASKESRFLVEQAHKRLCYRTSRSLSSPCYTSTADQTTSCNDTDIIREILSSSMFRKTHVNNAEGLIPSSVVQTPNDGLEAWKSHLLSYFGENIASEMVTIDDQRNGWRHLVLPVAHGDSLVRDAVLSSAAFHLSTKFGNYMYKPNAIYAQAIRKLQERQNLEFQDMTSKQSVLLALLVLLTTVMVNGSSDFPTVFNLLESALQAGGGEIALMQGELGDFVVKQIRKYRGYASPLLSQAKGVSRLCLTTRLTTLASQNMVDGWDCFMGYYRMYPQHSAGLSAVYALHQQSCDIYVARVLAGPNGPPLTDMVEDFRLGLRSIPDGTPGLHTLVFATFIAAAESVLPEHQEYFTEVLLKHHRRNGFANILLALDHLRSIWSGSALPDWTRGLPELRVFIV